MFGRRPAPSIHDNHTIPQKQLDAIAEAIEGRKPAIFHGGCNGCVWRHMNTTHEGIAFCRGCTFFYFNEGLPDKSRHKSERR